MDVNTTLVNATLPLLEPYVETVHDAVELVGVFVGGIFGFYILSFIWRVYTYKRNSQFFKGIRLEMKHLTESVNRLEKRIDGMERRESKKGGKRKGL